MRRRGTHLKYNIPFTSLVRSCPTKTHYLQITLAQRHKGYEVLNPVGIQVLQLNLVIIQKPMKKSMDGGREPAFMKMDERNDIASGQRRRVVPIRE